MIEKIKKELLNLLDKKYQAFSSKLTPNVHNILGVRLPLLRKIAKRISKENYQDFFKLNDDEFMELTMLEAMIVGYLPIKEQIKHIENFIPKINNWAVCDCFCSGLKYFKTNKNKIIFEKYFNSDKEYELRFAFVVLLNYFIDNDYNYVIDKISEFDNEQYYAKMAAAWCLSICIIKNYTQCLNDLKTLKIHPWVFKKGITKAIESLRLDKLQKEELKKLRNQSSS